MAVDVNYHIQRLGALRQERSSFDAQWEEAAARVIPAHRDSFTGRGQNVSAGEKKTELQFDATVSFAAQRFASVIESIITPANSLWSPVKVLDSVLRKNRQVRMYFDDLTRVLHEYRYRPAANFIGNSQAAYLSLGVYGNGSLYIDQPDDVPGLRYRNMPLAETYFAENHANIVDTVYRSYKLTPRQIVQLEKFWAVPEEVREAAKQPASADTKKYEILHVVGPRRDWQPGRLDGPGKKFMSVYI